MGCSVPTSLLACITEIRIVRGVSASRTSRIDPAEAIDRKVGHRRSEPLKKTTRV